MVRRTFALAALVALTGLTACQDLPTEPEAAVDAQMSRAGGKDVVASATGSAHRVRNGRALVYTFTARQMADGTAEGTYHVDFQDLVPGDGELRARFDVDVTCMSTSGNRAWIGGIISKVNGAIVREGTVSYFYVTDHGEGAGAVDEISAVRVNDVAGEDRVFCEEQPTLLPSVPIEKGNAQVRIH